MDIDQKLRSHHQRSILLSQCEKYPELKFFAYKDLSNIGIQKILNDAERNNSYKNYIRLGKNAVKVSLTLLFRKLPKCEFTKVLKEIINPSFIDIEPQLSEIKCLENNKISHTFDNIILEAGKNMLLSMILHSADKYFNKTSTIPSSNKQYHKIDEKICINEIDHELQKQTDISVPEPPAEITIEDSFKLDNASSDNIRKRKNESSDDDSEKEDLIDENESTSSNNAAKHFKPNPISQNSKWIEIISDEIVHPSNSSHGTFSENAQIDILNENFNKKFEISKRKSTENDKNVSTKRSKLDDYNIEIEHFNFPSNNDEFNNLPIDAKSELTNSVHGKELEIEIDSFHDTNVTKEIGEDLIFTEENANMNNTNIKSVEKKNTINDQNYQNEDSMCYQENENKTDEFNQENNENSFIKNQVKDRIIEKLDSDISNDSFDFIRNVEKNNSTNVSDLENKLNLINKDDENLFLNNDFSNDSIDIIKTTENSDDINEATTSLNENLFQEDINQDELVDTNSNFSETSQSVNSFIKDKKYENETKYNKVLNNNVNKFLTKQLRMSQDEFFDNFEKIISPN